MDMVLFLIVFGLLLNQSALVVGCEKLSILKKSPKHTMPEVEAVPVSVSAKPQGFWQMAMQAINHAVLTTDEKGAVTHLNPMAVKLTGWLSQDAMGKQAKRILKLVYEKTYLPIPDPVLLCLDNQQPAHYLNDTLLLSADGKEYAIELSVAPVLDSNGHQHGVVVMFHDVSTQRKMAKAIEYRATHDLLTGLSNRNELEQGLRRFVNNNRDPEQTHALMFIDLDRFKAVNDASGHAAGDKLLQEVAKIMKGCVRSSDLVARIGGDEFGIILRKCDTENALDIARKICEFVSLYRFYYNDKVFEIGASIGLVMINGSWESEAKLLQAADSACYQAKREGRNRVHVYFDADSDPDGGQLAIHWASRIEQALEEESFVLFCQKIQPISHQGKAHAEVLIRMKDKQGGLIGPDAFLPSAERFNMATRIDKWVVKQVFAWMQAHEMQMEEVAMLSVNLSGQSLGDLAFHQYVIKLIGQYAINCAKLCFEVTETSAITNINEAKKFIAAMKHLGVRFSLDDFGSGVSSFGYLNNLSVDYLKIDGQFIKDLIDNKIGQATVKCIAEVAKATGKQTIAEWVDNPSVETMLKKMGIDYTQGYLNHKPEPLSEMLSAESLEV